MIEKLFPKSKNSYFLHIEIIFIKTSECFVESEYFIKNIDEMNRMVIWSAH